MSCLGPNDADPRMAPVSAYDAGRPTEQARDSGTLPAREGALRDALLLAPEPPFGPDSAGTDDDWNSAYADWYRDVRNVAISRTEAPPRKQDRSLPLMAAVLSAPDPRNYEDSPVGDGALRRDLTTWMESALLLVQEAGK